jgi:arginine:pyruvate transaminase
MRYASITDRLALLGSDKWALHLRARALQRLGKEIIELTIGEPDVPADESLIAECQRSMNAGRYRYASGRGEPALVAALVDKYRARRSDVCGDNILCFPGTQAALFAVMLALAETGQSVLVGDPLYATYEGVIRATGANMVPVPLRADKGFHMQAADLESAITPQCRVLLLNSPHNPTGAVLTKEEIIAIGEVCKRHDLWIISDEVYEELIFDREFASPFDQSELADRTVAVSSISKSHAAPGFRSGWCAGPAEFCARLQPISETMLFGGQPFIADMTTLALTRPTGTSALMRANYLNRATRVSSALANTPGVVPLMPEAGMFILIDIAGTGLDGAAFAWGLLEEEGVAVMPGSSFGHQAKNLIRASLTVPDDKLGEACRRIRAFASRQEHAA